MKRIEEQTHYEILEVSPDADLKEIQRAYDHARETFHADSLAVYSLFSEEEMRKIQAVIEEAYRVLMDEALRKSYDQSHAHLIERSSREKQTEKPVKSSEIKGGLSFSDLSIEVGEITYRGGCVTSPFMVRRAHHERKKAHLKSIAARPERVEGGAPNCNTASRRG